MAKSKRRPRGAGGFRFDAKRGLWVGRVIVGRHKSGKPKYREVSDRTQAGCLRRMAAVQPASSSTTVAAWAEKWLTGLSVRPGTAKTYADLVRLHVAPGVGSLKLCDVRPSHVRTFTAALVAAHSAAFARQVVSCLRSILDAAVAEELIPKNPAKLAPKPKNEPVPLQPYAADELRLLIRSSAASSAGPVVALLAACGCRLGEAAALDVEDYADGKIKITKTYRPPNMGPPKSRRSRRTIGVPEVVRPVIVAAIAGRTTGVLFRRPGGGRYTAATIGAAFAPHCGRLGLPVKKLHALRHSVASHLVASGHPIADIAAYLGDSVATIVGTYVHPTGRDPVACLNKLFA